MGLLQFSQQFRTQLLNLNLPTPTEDVQNYLDAFGNSTYASYVNDLNQPAVIDWYQNVIDAGSISDHTVYLQNLLGLNKPLNPDDPSDTAFNSLLNDIGTQTTVNVNSVINQLDVESNSTDFRNNLLAKNKPLNPNDPSDTGGQIISPNTLSGYYNDLGQSAIINDFNVNNQGDIIGNLDNFIDLTTNKYQPRELELAQVLVNQLKNKTNLPYTHEGTNGFFQESNLLNIFDNENYTPSTFLEIDERVTIPRILLNGERVLENDTVLMNIAAVQLRSHFQNRINHNLERETLGKLNIFNASNPITAINLIKDPVNNLFLKNWDITTGLNPLQDAGRFAATLAGVEIPISPFRNYDVLTPTCFGSREEQTNNGFLTNLFRDFTGRTLENNDSDFLLARTGAGQKSQLYGNLKYNKYAPDYKPIYETEFFNGIDGLKEKINEVSGYLGLGAGTRPLGNYYLGTKETGGVVSILSDSDGDMFKSLDELSQQFNLGFSNPRTGRYGLLTGEMIWGTGSEEDLQSTDLFRNNPEAYSLLSGSKTFKECTILDKTQRLVNKGGIFDTINQTKNKFSYNGYTYSKGNATKKIEVQTDSLGNKIYKPTDEFCRTWTKVNPYTRVRDLIRNKELLRKERNSVLDRNGNLNIAPTDLNVKRISGIYDIDDNRTEGFNELRARKYMFSIENLAWKDSNQFKKLPDYEKGPNGGRVMWFPPYDLKFDETSSANWQDHDFLGRPEPIYTYNNTERVGNLSFKVIVDHPTILNVLVDKEFQNISESEIDEVINSFWAGCLEFDIYELARIWGVFSTSELEYFKKVINSIQKAQPNEVIRDYNLVNETVGYEDEITTTFDIGDDVFEDLTKYKAYYPDGVSTSDGGDYSNIYQDYLELIQNSNIPNQYYYNTLSKNSEFINEYENLIIEIENLLKTHKGKDITIELETSLSPLESKIQSESFAHSRFRSFVESLNVHKNANLTEEKFDESIITLDDESKITFKNVVKTPLASSIIANTNQLNGEYILEQVDDSGNIAGVTLCSLDSFTNSGINICSVYSLPASKSRYVKVKNVQITQNETFNEINNSGTNEQNRVSVTKRDIARRLLNKLVTEGDYFRFLEEDSPFIYNTLREKLKYFTPAFHSTTPEGLNSRLTFLNQCLRPGETIKNLTSSSCDANNTSFGKPPVCVLRLGDFFNTKMIITNLNISYDETTWDMNPEGVGMQPMIANVQLTVKYFGGQGLRKPVEKLQNALSFDYYSNTEIYDERSFANTDEFERNLIIQERDFFNNNQLDLVDIVESTNGITVSPSSQETIGDFKTSSTIDISEDSLLTALTENDKLDTFDLDYKSTFKSLYTNYNEYITTYINYQEDILKLGDNSALLANQVLFNNRDIKLLNNISNNTNTISVVKDRIKELTKLKNYSQTGVEDKLLKSLTNGQVNIIKLNLHLYPQKDLYTLTNGSTGLGGYITGGTSAVIPDDFTGIVLPTPPDLSVTENKNFIYYCDSFEDKIDTGLLSVLSKDNITNKFDQLLPEQRKLILNTIKSEFQQYKQNVASVYEGNITRLRKLYQKILVDLLKLSAITSGVDGIVDRDEFYEVIPNETEISGNISNSFNYNPYYEIETLAIDSDYTNTIDDNVVLIGDEKIESKLISTTDSQTSSLEDNLQVGNLNYIKNQLSGIDFQINNLPQLDYSNNPPTWSINNGQTITTNGDKSTIDSSYNMTYIFEKINYEVFNFGQITLNGLSMDRTPLGDRTEIQDVIIEPIILELNSNQTNILINNREINNIQFSPNNNTNKHTNIYNKFNNLVEVKKVLTKKNYDYIINNIDLTMPDFTGAEIKTNSIEELIFMDFMVSLNTDNFKNNLKNQLDDIKFSRADIRNSNTKRNKAKDNARKLVDILGLNITTLNNDTKDDFRILKDDFTLSINNYQNHIKPIINNLIQNNNTDNNYTLRFRKTDNPSVYGKNQLIKYNIINKFNG